jgi:hypothetical protein
MLYTPNIESYSKLTEKINRKYAQKKNYDFILFKQRLSNDRAPQWDKIKAIEKCFNLGYKYVFWIDSDAYFNGNTSLEEFLDNENEIYICDDLRNSNKKCLINTGTILIKNTEYTRELISKWWNWGDKKWMYEAYHEQKVLDDMIKNDFMKIGSRIKIYPDDTFNSYISQIYTEREKLFVVHMMATDEKTRIKIATQKCNELRI